MLPARNTMDSRSNKSPLRNQRKSHPTLGIAVAQSLGNADSSFERQRYIPIRQKKLTPIPLSGPDTICREEPPLCSIQKGSTSRLFSLTSSDTVDVCADVGAAGWLDPECRRFPSQLVPVEKGAKVEPELRREGPVPAEWAEPCS